MKSSVRSLIVSVVLAIVGCTDGAPNFSLVPEFEAATEIYYEKDATAAEVALSGYLDRVQENIEHAKQDRQGDFRALLAMTWLRLASLYHVRGDGAKFEKAMRSAIVYFDQDPRFIADTKYQQDKERRLLDILQQVEAERMPRWRKTVSSGERPKSH